MLSVGEALDLILSEGQPLAEVNAGLEHGYGKVLRKNISSNDDSPPFTKSMMDGFGIKYGDFAEGKRSFKCTEIISAGMHSMREILTGETVQIMTGAPIPPGVDTVIPVELTSHDSQSSPISRDVNIQTEDVRSGQHILRQGGNYVKGHVIVPGGRRIRAQELAALCEAGITEFPVTRELTVSIMATGNELVSPFQTPAAGQIRNSNELMLVTQIKQAYGKPIPLGVARDQLSEIQDKVRLGLKEDILILTGGVSAGTLDLVPQVLKSEGVRQVFHKLAMKPGKPVWFGVKEYKHHKTYVFGLPGNPVSSMICFELLVKPLMEKLSGLHEFKQEPSQAVVVNNYPFRSDRITYHPVNCFWQRGILYAKILKWGGSSDLTSTVLANGMGIMAAGERDYLTGELLDVLIWT